MFSRIKLSMSKVISFTHSQTSINHNIKHGFFLNNSRAKVFVFLVLKNNVRPRLNSVIVCLLGVLRRFQRCTGHITTGSWKGRGNQYIQFVRVLYCKLSTNGNQLPAFPLEAVQGTKPRPQRWEARVLPLCHRGPCVIVCESGSGRKKEKKISISSKMV